MSNKKKVLIIHHSGAIGGAGVSLLHILKSIKNFNLNVTVYCPENPNDMKLEIKKLGYRIVSKPKVIPIIQHYSGSSMHFFSFRTIRNLFSIFKGKKHVKRLIEQVNPDTVIVNSMTLSYVGKLAKEMKKNIETICFHRETYAKGFLGIRTKLIKYQLSNYFDKVIFISKHDLKQSGNMKTDTFIITDKVQLSEYQEDSNLDYPIEKEDEKILRLLYTGGMQKLKGAHLIIKALAKCKSNVKLIFLQYNGEKRKKELADYNGFKDKVRFILGKDYTAKTLKLIDKNKLWDRIDFYPTVVDVTPFFNSCDVVVFPSTAPHQARPIYEAGAVKKPIIITGSTNIKEFVVSGENGLLFKSNDAESFASEINKLSNDRQLIKDMGYRNYIRTIQYHDFDNLESELKEVLL